MDIVKLVIAGDSDLYSVLVSRYHDKIQNVVRRYVSNTDDAADITQDALIKAYSNLEKFKGDSQFYSWLCRIAINKSIDFVHTPRNKRSCSLDELLEEGFESASEVCNGMTRNPEKIVIEWDERVRKRRAIKAGISRLPIRLRKTFILYHVMDMSLDGVSNLMQIPIGTVKSRSSRARAEMQSILTKRK